MPYPEPNYEHEFSDAYNPMINDDHDYDHTDYMSECLMDTNLRLESHAPYPHHPTPSMDLSFPSHPTTQSVLASISVFTLVRDVHDSLKSCELFRADTQYDVEFRANELANYATFRNAIKQRTAAYLRSQFFRICRLSDIRDHIVPFNGDGSSRASRSRSGVTMSTHKSIDWLLTDADLDVILEHHRANLPHRDSRLELGVVRYTKAQAATLSIADTSPEYKYFDEVFSSRRAAHGKVILNSGKYVGEWLRGGHRLDDELVVQPALKKHGQSKITITDRDRVCFTSGLNEVAVPRSLAYVTVREDVLSKFLEFAFELQQAFGPRQQVTPEAVAEKIPSFRPALDLLLKNK
ncbi:hypothetical protein GMRT_11965 [Giardia muris]|uniref:Uncharacterized protein n=1 Tax=Giardia muris TaxID=5742 RepID=A0A4Z1STH2_GIAMU|nr:hypothetical protein GMRT_11965 [Giardia muris]|eukprot:TNJ29222.1 hypothetical protein GMRT_11965 [Giardia muris]